MQTLLTRFRARDRAVSSSSGTRSTTSTDTNETQMPSTPPPVPPLPVGYTSSDPNTNMSTPTTPTRYERKIHPHVDALLEEYASAPSSPTSVTSPLSPARHGHGYFGDMPGGLAPAPPTTPHAQKEVGTPPNVSRNPSDSSPATPIRPPRAHTRAPSSGSPLPVSPEYEPLDFESEPTRDQAFFDAFERAHYGRSYSGSSSPTIDSHGRFRRLSRVSLPGAADVWSTFGRRSVDDKDRERPMSISSVPSVSAVGGAGGGVGRGGPSAWFTRKGGKGKKKRKSREGSVRSAASSGEGSGSGHGSASGHVGNISKESSGNASMDRSGNTSGSKDGGGSTRSSRKGKENRPLPSPPGSAFHAHAPANRPGSAFGTPVTPAQSGGPISPALSAFNAPSVSTLGSPIPSLHQAAGSPASSLASPQSSFASPQSSFAINIAVQPPTRTGSPARAVPMGYGYTYPQERERRMSVDEVPTPRKGGRPPGGSVGVEVQGTVGIASPSPGTQRKHAPLRAYRSVPRANAIFPSSSPIAPFSALGPKADGEERRPSAALFAAQALQEEDEDDFGRVEWPARVSGEIIRLSLGSPSRRQSAFSSAAYSRQSALSSASGTTELGERIASEENAPGRKSIDTVGTFGPRPPARVQRTLSDGRPGAMATRPSPHPHPNSNAASNTPLSLPASTVTTSSSASPTSSALDASTAPTSHIYTAYSGASAASDANSPSTSTYTAMQNNQDNGLLTPGPSTPVPSAPATPRQTKPLRSSLRSRPAASPASFADSGLGIRSTATKTYPSDAARLLAERLERGESVMGEDGTETPTGKGKGKRKADDSEVTPPDMRRARFGSDVDELGALPAAFSFSHAPSSYGNAGPSRNPKRARLNSPEPLPPSAQGQHSNNNFGRTQSRASSRPYSRGTANATPESNARREKRTSLSGASIPISALVAPHAPSMSHLTDGSYRMRDPRKPASRKMHTPWSLRRRNADAGEEGSPIQAWLFYLGFLTLIAWFIGAFWRVPRTRVLKEGGGGDEEKGREVLVDDPQVEFDARRWRVRCRVMSVVGVCTYVPFVVLVGVFVGR